MGLHFCYSIMHQLNWNFRQYTFKGCLQGADLAKLKQSSSNKFKGVVKIDIFRRHRTRKQNSNSKFHHAKHLIADQWMYNSATKVHSRKWIFSLKTDQQYVLKIQIKFHKN